ncbi:hypothetical protein IB244_18590 [Rhizobium sp. RHZ02]|uniref:hypothetical protein n=1 Tax=Rhizobium sp. RHZ02 TaxID=2769306 RepID=UPI0017831047|nr:hypothetical protein [Rhizobium sp. RHZ02]MBD9453546.1 hypothetical protein [Rhizobium sp. RHZ02]
MPEYEDRLILFIDFLGFKEHVDHTIDDPTFLDRLVHALETLREVGMEQEVFPSQQMTHFSDSVALSFRIDERSAVFWMLTQIRLAIFNLAGEGFLVRGAVTAGPLYHTSEILVGPAMVRAYQLESRIAVFPRVLIDPAVIEIARVHRSSIHHADDEEQYVRSGLAMAEDEWLWIDYISYEAYESAGAETDEYPFYLERIGQMIAAGLGHSSTSVVRKHVWLHPCYVGQIELFESIGPQEDETMEAQRSYVANLPTFASEMADALARIAAEDALQAAAANI